MTLPEILEFVLRLIDVLIIPLIFALAFVAFLWGIYQSFIAGGADEEKRAKGRQIMMFGIIGFVIMFSVWSLVSLVRASLGFGNEARPAFPVFDSTAGKSGASQNSTINIKQGTVKDIVNQSNGTSN